MQCYSLATMLKKELPEHTVEVVDYTSYNLLHDYNRSFIRRIIGDRRTNGSKPLILIMKRFGKSILSFKTEQRKRLSDKAIYEKFNNAQKLLPLSTESVVSDNVADFYKTFQGKYDVLIVGSDAIWNNNQTSWPNLYFLHDIYGCKKFSYAASTYGMDYSLISDEQKKYVCESLKDFSFVGVRDEVSEQYVLECTNKEIHPKHTCDPSVILDLCSLPVNMDELKKKLSDNGVDLTKPIVGFMCSSWLAKTVRMNLGENFQYVSVYERNGYEDICLDFLTPFEWARVFSLFNATFTHFFHGTMFSLKNGTLTFSVEKNSDYKFKYTTKIQDALHRMNLDSCYYEFEKLTTSDWKRIKRMISEEFHEQNKNRYVEELRKESESFDIFLSCLRKNMDI